MSQVSNEEESILRNAIFALQGIEGEHLQFDTNHDWTSTNNTTPLHQQRFQLVHVPADDENNATALHKSKLGSGAADALMMIGEAGWLYTRIQTYLHHVGQQRAAASVGSIQRALASALEQEMNDYRAFLVQLEAKTLHHGNNNNEHAHLRDLLVSLQRPLRRLHTIAMITDGLTVDMTGGPLLRALEQHTCHGDAQHVELVLKLLTAGARPWLEMLLDWTTRGLLPVHEPFFVAQTAQAADRDVWRNRYQLNVHQLPPVQIFSRDMVQKALQVGKGINFIRHCLMDGEYSLGALEHEARACFVYQPSSPVDGTNMMQNDFGDCLDRMAETVNQHILKSLREEHNIRQHFYCLKQFLLLGQGDFVANLTEALHNEYENHKGVVGIYRHTLASLMEGALRASNASFLPKDCLQRLQVELRLSPDDAVNYKFGPDKESENDTRTVWDIFELEYTVPAPVLAVIEPKVMEEYRNLFTHLFGLRKIEYYINFTWRQSAMLSHNLQAVAQHLGVKFQSDPAYARAVVLLRRIAITRQAMTNFVVSLKSFLMLEVIEGGWKNLERKLEDSDSLDTLTEAHEDFVTSICRQSLLQNIDDNISDAIHDLLEHCNQFSLYQRNLFGQAILKAEKAAAKRRLAVERESEGNWGFDEIENSQEEESNFFGLSDASKMRDLDMLSGHFHDTMRTLLRSLDSTLNGDQEVNKRMVTPTKYGDSRDLADTFVLDEDLKLLRDLRAQLDQNQFYQKDL